jgi:hypothetical protein
MRLAVRPLEEVAHVKFIVDDWSGRGAVSRHARSSLRYAIRLELLA